jgi:tetratricopeptide (TPR) repeat protein
MTKKLLIALPVLFLISSLVYGQAQTQTQVVRTAAIDGSIVLPTNQAMERYEILLLSKDGEQVIARTYTDLSGRYHFGNLSPDNVDVVVRIEGFEESRVPVKLAPGRGTIVNMILTVKPMTSVEDSPWDSKVVQIDELSRKYPRKAVDDFQKGLESKRKGDTAKAQELIEGVVKLSPDFSDAHNLLGTLYQGMNRYRDAEKQYNLSRSLSPSSLAPLINLATLYLQEAEASEKEKEGPLVTGVIYDDALHVLQDATRVDPRNATVYYLLGITFYRARSYRFAEVSFNEALSIDVHVGAVRLALANVYIRQQKWREALDQFDKYLAENPKATDRTLVEAIRSKVIQQL